MSVEGSAIFSTATVEPNVSRRSASFSPSIWGDHFLSYATDSMETSDKAEHKKLKEEVKRELMANINKPSQTLDFIDAIQRVGISYHFEIEIDEILREMYRSHCDFDNGDDDDHHHNDLYAISLKFRLLRQQGYKISCDVFGKFKNSQGYRTFCKKLDFAKKLPFARDRVIECYFWILGVYFEPEYFLARRMLTKVIAMTSVIDDIYDVYGTPEELELFTDAIERWEITAVDQLPEYMKVTYKALLDVYTEIEENMVSEERSYRVYYAKEAMKNQVRAYCLESKWFHQKHTPTMEEYMAVALVTSAYAMLEATSFVGMGHVVTKDSFDWLFRGPKILKASEIICRLMDDIVSHKFEQKRGHVASSIECYMKQHGTTEQETVHEFRKQVTDAWKDVNEEFLHPTAVPMPLLTRMLNLARVIDVVYKDEDGYTNAGTALKDLVSAILIDPVTM
nr:(-)-germacrene D synthase-like [Populus alba]